MTVGTTPESLSVEKDLNFVKVGLLYGDRVKLESLGASIILDLFNISKVVDERQIVKILQVVMKAMGNDDFDRMVYLLFKRGNLTRDEVLFKMQFRRLLKEQWEELRKKAQEMLDNSGVEGLEEAYNTGLLQIERYLINSFENSDDDLIWGYIDRLNTSVLSGKTYPIFDETVADIIRMKNDENSIDMTTSEQINKRMKHGSLTFDFLNRLPSFELAQIKEVMDIRKELDKPLKKFRALMLKYSNEINSEVWQDAFMIEVEDKFREEIEPVVQEIEEFCESNNYLKELSGQVFQNWSAPATIGLAFATVSEYLNISQACIGGAAKIAYDGVVSYKRYKEQLKSIENHQLYFYYKAGKLIGSLR